MLLDVTRRYWSPDTPIYRHPALVRFSFASPLPYHSQLVFGCNVPKEDENMMMGIIGNVKVLIIPAVGIPFITVQ